MNTRETLLETLQGKITLLNQADLQWVLQKVEKELPELRHHEQEFQRLQGEEVKAPPFLPKQPNELNPAFIALVKKRLPEDKFSDETIHLIRRSFPYSEKNSKSQVYHSLFQELLQEGYLTNRDGLMRFLMEQYDFYTPELLVKVLLGDYSKEFTYEVLERAPTEDKEALMKYLKVLSGEWLDEHQNLLEDLEEDESHTEKEQSLLQTYFERRNKIENLEFALGKRR